MRERRLCLRSFFSLASRHMRDFHKAGFANVEPAQSVGGQKRNIVQSYFQNLAQKIKCCEYQQR